jgi:hypothetical protein
MIKIRQEQAEVFEREARQNFERRLAEHVCRSYPRHARLLGDAGVRAVVADGLARAGGYALTTESNVRFFIDLMFLLGRNFDTDLQLPWAAETLADASLPEEALRVDRLYDRAMEYLHRVAGPKNEHLDAALARLADLRLDAVPAGGAALYDYLLGLLRRVYPEKCDDLGELTLRRLIGRGIERAKGYGVTGGRGVAVFVGLMFMLGGGFDTDPQFAWAAAALGDEGAPTEEQKVDRLYAGAMRHLAEWRAEEVGGGRRDVQ